MFLDNNLAGPFDGMIKRLPSAVANVTAVTAQGSYNDGPGFEPLKVGDPGRGGEPLTAEDVATHTAIQTLANTRVASQKAMLAPRKKTSWLLPVAGGTLLLGTLYLLFRKKAA